MILFAATQYAMAKSHRAHRTRKQVRIARDSERRRNKKIQKRVVSSNIDDLYPDEPITNKLSVPARMIRTSNTERGTPHTPQD